MVDASLALADLRARGLISEVGVTNMDCAALAAMLDAGAPVVSNQVQFSLLDRRPLTGGMVDLCRARGVKVRGSAFVCCKVRLRVVLCVLCLVG
jgi:aryl-alcohol dehydrogenase-like predicted oxidoreductase